MDRHNTQRIPGTLIVTALRREDIAIAKFTDIQDRYWYCEQSKTKMKIRVQGL